jgi:hypothetical protein
MMINFNLTKDQFGAISLIDAQGIVHPSIRIIRAFPISNPSHGFAIVDQNGHELVWLNDLSQLPNNLKELIQTELYISTPLHYRVFGTCIPIEVKLA